MVKSFLSRVLNPHEVIGERLSKDLERLQVEHGCKVLNVFETKIRISNAEDNDKQAFIIVYDDGNE